MLRGWLDLFFRKKKEREVEREDVCGLWGSDSHIFQVRLPSYHPLYEATMASNNNNNNNNNQKKLKKRIN
jgi:hypothetical protein